MTRTGKVVVVGGGLAGSMAALELAQAGHDVTQLEKTTGPHDKVCGEFLSRESLHYLQRHELHPHALGGVPVYSVRLITNRFTRESRLPFAAWSLSRKTLDEAMLRTAEYAGVKVQRGAHVTTLNEKEGKWNISLREGSSIRASDLVLATGKHDLNGRPRPEGRQGDLVAFKMYYRLTAEQHRQLGSTVELLLYPGGYAGLQPVEGGVVNLSLLIRSRHLRRAGSSWHGVLRHVLEHSPHLQNRLQGAIALLQKPLTVSRIGYGHLQRSTEDHLWRVGDQAAVIPSFCGDGMSIALHSGALAASCLLHGMSADAYQRYLHDQLRYRMWAATKLSTLLVDLPQITQAVRFFPSLLATIATMTRIPNDALMSTQRTHDYSSGKA